MTGDEVKSVRLENGLSQEAFGKMIGISKVAVSNIESGKRSVTKQTELLITLMFQKNRQTNIAMTYFVSWIFCDQYNRAAGNESISMFPNSDNYEIRMIDIERMEEMLQEKYHLSSKPVIINFQKIGEEPNGSGKEL